MFQLTMFAALIDPSVPSVVMVPETLPTLPSGSEKLTSVY
jgi:hypothetical protein